MSSIMDAPCVCGWGGLGPCPCPRNRQIDNAWTPGLLSVWDDCAVTAMQSLPKSRKPSLKA